MTIIIIKSQFLKNLSKHLIVKIVRKHSAVVIVFDYTFRNYMFSGMFSNLIFTWNLYYVNWSKHNETVWRNNCYCIYIIMIVIKPQKEQHIHTMLSWWLVWKQRKELGTDITVFIYPAYLCLHIVANNVPKIYSNLWTHSFLKADLVTPGFWGTNLMLVSVL